MTLAPAEGSKNMRTVMPEYTTNATWDELADSVRSARRIVVTTHQRPDGDALGSVLALHRGLSTPEREVEIALMGPLESALAGVAGETPYGLVERDGPPAEADLVIVADTGAWTQLEPLAEWLRARQARVIGLDHHARGDDVAARRIVDPSAASATVLVARLLEMLGVPFGAGDNSVAEALFVGLATDTGWFRHPNADARAFALASRLLEHDVNKSRLHQMIEESHPVERLAIQARALSSLTFAVNGTVAIQALSLRDFAETGTTAQNLVGLVNGPMSAGAVRVAVLLAEAEPGLTKLSFRAKPGGGAFTDVNELAQEFGGGGHVFAAGARIAAPLDEARRRLLAVLDAGTPPAG